MTHDELNKNSILVHLNMDKIEFRSIRVDAYNARGSRPIQGFAVKNTEDGTVVLIHESLPDDFCLLRVSWKKNGQAYAGKISLVR
jgi:hypothetical protein